MSPVFKRRLAGVGSIGNLDRLGRLMAALGETAYHRRRLILLVGAAVIAIAVPGALMLTVNDSRLMAFPDDHPIVKATKEINDRFDGTSQLNIVLTASDTGALVRPDVLRRVAALEAFTETLPHVGGTHSLSGWIKRAHQIMNQDDPAYFTIPEDSSVTRFYLDVLGAASSPLAPQLHKVIDSSYTVANLIVRLKSSQYVHQREVISAVREHLDEHFSDQTFSSQLAGRANLDYHWLALVRSTHIWSVAFSMACVLLLTGVMFRSLVAGFLCAFTVGVAVLVNYAIMGLSGIPLGVGTSMFASIAIGAGVNFPIHLLDRLRVEFRSGQEDVAGKLRQALAFTGRALFFTAFVVAVGFLLLCVSEFRTLVRFGLLIGTGMVTSFVVSVTLVPALIATFRPRFIFGRNSRQDVTGRD